MIPLKDHTSLEGTKAVLECKVSVAHITSVKWYFNDQPIQFGDRIQTVAKGAKQRLVISRSFASDEGCYKLVIGKTETSCNLTIESMCQIIMKLFKNLRLCLLKRLFSETWICIFLYRNSNY